MARSTAWSLMPRRRSVSRNSMRSTSLRRRDDLGHCRCPPTLRRNFSMFDGRLMLRLTPRIA